MEARLAFLGHALMALPPRHALAIAGTPHPLDRG